MVAIPLAATLFTAIIRWQRNREVRPTAESSCLNTGLNLYGTLKTNGSSGGEINSSTSEENSKYNVCDSAKIRYSVYVQFYWIMPFVDNTGYNPRCFPRSCVYRCLQAFSLQTTSQGVFSTSSSIPGGGYSSLNGIRVLSLLWIICGHSAQFPVINTLGMTRLTATCSFSLQVIQILTFSHCLVSIADNYKNWKKTVESSPLYVLTIGGPVFLAVDTFLLLGWDWIHEV